MDIQEARDYIRSLPISSIIQFYLPLSQKGKNHEAICPFHADTRPSMKVNDEKNMFKCFVCDEAGDSISFVQKYLQIGFVESLESIAQHLGITVEKKVRPVSEKERKATDFLHWAAKFYRHFALNEPTQPYLNFLKERNLSAKLVENFQLGYAPNQSRLYQTIRSWPAEKSKLALELGLELGLIQSYQDRYFDTFRDRVMFPIWNRWGDIKGFGSRRLGESKMAKYINSKESFLFNKKNILYGLNFASKSIKKNDRVFLTEGYMDTIAMHQAEITETIAIMGTGFSQYNAKQLTNFTTNIYLALDSDPAGIKAARRCGEAFLIEGNVPKVLNFQPYKDPDEYIAHLGQKGLQDLTLQAPSYLDYFTLIIIEEQGGSDHIDHKLVLLNAIFELLSPIGDHLLAHEHLAKYGKKLGFSSGPEYLSQQYLRYLSNGKNDSSSQDIPRSTSQINEVPKKPASPAQHQIDSDEKTTTDPSLNEQLLLKEILHYPDVMLYIKFEEFLDDTDRTGLFGFLKEIQVLYNEVEQEDFFKLLKELVASRTDWNPYKKLIYSLLYENEPESIKKDELKIIALDLKLKIKENRIKARRSILMQKHQQATRTEEINDLLTKIHQINQEILNLRNKNHRINGASS
jgi:DNA primase